MTQEERNDAQASFDSGELEELTAAEAIRQFGDAYNRARLTPTVKGIFHRLMALKR